MNIDRKVLVMWSGGKDSAFALHELKRAGVGVASLLTTVTEGYDRISMHGVRRELLLKQIDALGYPLEEMTVPQESTNEIYEKRMEAILGKFRLQGVSTVAFGDLFLEDIRAYREEFMRRIGMDAIFPLWKKNTAELAREFIRTGFRAVITCVDTQKLAREFSGREFDGDFLRDLPESVDPCGENGEFHSFVYDGPIFSKPVPVKKGEKILRNERFYYCDIF